MKTIYIVFYPNFWPEAGKKKNPNISCKSLLSPLAISPEAGQQQDSNYRSQSWQWSTLPLCYCCYPVSFLFHGRKCTKTCEWLDKIIADHFRHISLHEYSTTVLWSSASENNIHCFYPQPLIKPGKTKSQLFCKSLLSPLLFSPGAGLRLDSNPRSQSRQWSTLPLCYCCYPTSFYFMVKNAQKPVSDLTR